MITPLPLASPLGGEKNIEQMNKKQRNIEVKISNYINCPLPIGSSVLLFN